MVIDPVLCTGCGLCVRDCPAFALELEHGSSAQSASKGREKFRLIHYHDRCAYCGQCEASCRFGAIVLNNDFVPASPSRDELRQVMVDRDSEKSHESE